MFFNDRSRNLGNEKKTSSIRLRKLRFEPLECREMLTVTAVDFNIIRAAYPDLNLSTNMSDYNVIEIAADQLSAQNLQSAINTAAGTTKSDLIVVRTGTSPSQKTITLTGTELGINIDAATRGSVTIVSLGTDGQTTGELTINADGKSRVFHIWSTSRVALAGMTITGGGCHRVRRRDLQLWHVDGDEFHDFRKFGILLRRRDLQRRHVDGDEFHDFRKFGILFRRRDLQLR